MREVRTTDRARGEVRPVLLLRMPALRAQGACPHRPSRAFAPGPFVEHAPDDHPCRGALPEVQRSRASPCDLRSSRRTRGVPSSADLVSRRLLRTGARILAGPTLSVSCPRGPTRGPARGPASCTHDPARVPCLGGGSRSRGQALEVVEEAVLRTSGRISPGGFACGAAAHVRPGPGSPTHGPPSHGSQHARPRRPALASPRGSTPVPIGELTAGGTTLTPGLVTDLSATGAVGPAPRYPSTIPYLGKPTPPSASSARRRWLGLPLPAQPVPAPSLPPSRIRGRAGPPHRSTCSSRSTRPSRSAFPVRQPAGAASRPQGEAAARGGRR